MIHCVGDSHVCLFSGHNRIHPEWPAESPSLFPFFRTYRLGAVTAYNLCETASSTGSREKLWAVISSLPDADDWLMLSFGEIDCRAHFLKQARLQDKSPAEIATHCVERYGEVIAEVRRKRAKVVVYN